MICPMCKELNQKSILYIGLLQATSVYYQPYYDEDGLVHHHIPKSCSVYHCSKGHLLDVKANNKCENCDFGSPLTVSVYENTLTFNENTLTFNGTSGNLVINTGEKNV